MSHIERGVGSLVIYGANGFVGAEAARAATSRGLHPVLAGRDETAVTGVARTLGVESRVFALSDANEVRAGLNGTAVVLNMAGPFVRTYRPLVEACLDVGAHYVDITGEMDVLIGMGRYASAAEDSGVMLMPGAGLDSVPADCLAAELQGRLPAATRLRLGLQTTGPAGLPPGTKRTMIGLAHLPDRVIRDGQVVEAGGPTTMKIDFGRGPVTAVRYQAADTLVAYRTTGIVDIEAYVALPALLRLA